MTSSTTSKSGRTQFPGVGVQPVWLRTYPLHDVAAQLFGTIGPISPGRAQGTKRFQGLAQSSIVGQSGLEGYYNHYLQGSDGRRPGAGQRARAVHR